MKIVREYQFSEAALTVVKHLHGQQFRLMDDDQPLPNVGDLVSFEALGDRLFRVVQKQMRYAEDSVTVVLTLGLPTEPRPW